MASNDGISSLEGFVKKGDVTALTEELSSGDFSEDELNSALHVAARESQVECFKVLLDAGAQGNSVDADCCNSIILVTKYGNGSIDIIKAAIENNPTGTFICLCWDMEGKTGLLHAAERGQWETVDYLIEQGSDERAIEHIKRP